MIDHGEPSDATIMEMVDRIRWWRGEDRHGNPWHEWRRKSGARGGRHSSVRELAKAVWDKFGNAWRELVMLVAVARGRSGSQ